MKCFLHSNEKLAHIAGVKHIPNVSTFVAPKPGATLDVDEEVQEGVAKGTIVDDIEEMGHPLSILPASRCHPTASGWSRCR